MTDETIIDGGGEFFTETVHQCKEQHLLPGVNAGLSKGVHPIIMLAAMMELMAEMFTTLRHEGNQEAAQAELGG